MNDQLYYKIKIAFKNLKLLDYIKIEYAKYYYSVEYFYDEFMIITFIFDNYHVDHILNSQFIIENSIFNICFINDYT